jgi:phosphoglycerate dehydrogenase-like enzyme
MEPSLYVLITEPFGIEIVERLEAISPRLGLHIHPANRVEEIPPAMLARAEILYTLRAVPAPEQAPTLKWVQFHLAGLDRFAEHPLLAAGVQFTTLSGAAAPQIAEYVLMMMLALGHRLPEMQKVQSSREWPRDLWERFSPRELRGATVGVVGYGSVGREVARICHALGARILAVKRDVMHPEDSGFSAPGLGDAEGMIPTRIYPPQAIRRMLGECDYVIISAPLTEGTKTLFDAAMIAAMRPNAFLIDVSRGGILDEDALVKALEDGHLAGAALDVFAREPLPPESPLWTAPNLLVSPHISSDSPLYDQRAAGVFGENLRRYLAGQPLVNRFDPERGY